MPELDAVAYIERATVPGAADLRNVADLIPCARGALPEVFESPHDTDAHFVCYSMADGADHPRLRKSCLPHIRAVGGRVVMRLMAVDIDRPRHLPWGDIAEVEEVVSRILELGADWWPLSHWRYFYTTRAGYRLVYELERPIEPEVWERAQRALVAHLKSVDFDADPACCDWTRIFRLPDVMRDGLQQGTRPWYLLLSQPGRLISRTRVEDLAGHHTSDEEWSRLFPSSRKSLDSEALEVNETFERPTEEDAYELLYVQDRESGREKMSEWLKCAKAALKGQPYFDALFNGAPLAHKGERDNVLMKTVGSVCGLLHGRFDTSIAHVYGLLLEAVKGLEPDAGTTNWPDSLWLKVCRIWAREEAKAKVIEVRKERTEQENRSVEASIVEGMSSWCKHPCLKVEADGSISQEAAEFMYRHFIAAPSTGREYYVMRPDGRYDVMPTTAQTIVTRLRALYGDDGILPLRVVGEKSSRWVTPTELINAYATPVKSVTLRADSVMGGAISDIDTDRAALCISPFERSSALNPEYNADVDQWLKLFFGSNYIQGCRWIAWALAFEEGPICAMSICGPSGTGKSLLVEGLKECLLVPDGSDFSDLTGDWQYGLAASPYVFADEGLSSQTKAHPADVFRRLIGRSQISANRKNLAPITISTDVRICFTANNHSLVRSLTANREVTVEDREALMIRLLHFDIDGVAADWLISKGGRRFTHRWVSDGKHSDYVVAKHFLWLHSRRGSYAKDDRLLVQGNMDERVMDELRLHSGFMDLVMEAIARMLQAPQGSKRRGETRITEHGVHVLVSDVHRYITDEMKKSVPIRNVRNLLKNIVPSHKIDNDGNIASTTIAGERRRWYPVDLNFLFATCSEYGWDVTQIHREMQMLDPSFAPSLKFPKDAPNA